MTQVEVAVVGGGVMGSATARALARRGIATALLERFEFGHARGSSHGSSRIFRFSYPETEYVRMAIEALELWRELERESEEELLFGTGGLDCGDDVEANAEAMSQCGIESIEITRAEVSRRWPHMAPPDKPMIYQEGGAMIASDRAWRAFVAGASRHLADVHENSRVTEVRPRDDLVEIVTEAGNYEAETVVITAGGWAPVFLAGLDISANLRPTRQTVAHYELGGPPTPTYVEWGQRSIYALPSPGIGVKVGGHDPGDTIDPDTEGSLDESSLEVLDEWVRSRYPGAGRRVKAESCIYTNTPDESFVLERHGRIVVGSPCSGHGFKFAPLIGERLADLAVD